MTTPDNDVLLERWYAAKQALEAAHNVYDKALRALREAEEALSKACERQKQDE